MLVRLEESFTPSGEYCPPFLRRVLRFYHRQNQIHRKPRDSGSRSRGEKKTPTMKLLQFVTNSLPRRKSKSKSKKSSSKSSCSDGAESVEEPAIYTDTRTFQKTFALPVAVQDDQKRHWSTGSFSDHRIDFNVNFNIAADTELKCACYKHIEFPDTPVSPEQLSRGDEQYFTLDDSAFFTLPRTRNRIKTNPWIPPPKASSTDEAIASAPVVPAVPAIATLPRRGKRGARMGTPATSPACRPPLLGNLYNIPLGMNGNRENYEANTLSVANRNRTLYYSSDEGGRESSPSPVHSRIGYAGSSQSLNSTSSLSENDNSCHDISFHYEEEFESQVESVFSSCETLRDVGKVPCDPDTDDGVFLDSADSDEYDLSINERGDSYSRSSLSRDSLDGIADVPPGSPSFVGSYCTKRKSSDDLSLDTIDLRVSGSAGAISGQMTESIDSAIETGTCSSETSGGRSVHEIRHNLEHRVRQLREEKRIIDEKVQEAMQEERIRRQERDKFQKMLTLHRKSILLKTLQDLKLKLESQSSRLQQAYNNVLGMQSQTLRQHIQPRPLVASQVDAREMYF